MYIYLIYNKIIKNKDRIMNLPDYSRIRLIGAATSGAYRPDPLDMSCQIDDTAKKTPLLLVQEGKA